MNYNKVKFTVDEFLKLPVYEFAREANTGEVFLLKGSMSNQQDYLSSLLLNLGVAKIVKEIELENIKNPHKNNNIKVRYWQKYADGNVKECGASIIVKDDTIEVKGNTITFNMGDDNLKLETTGE